jgi:hypothetical protein
MITTTKLCKAELETLRFAALERMTKARTNVLAVRAERTKTNAAARARIARLRELGLVVGVALTEEGFRIGLAEHERVEARRAAAPRP